MDININRLYSLYCNGCVSINDITSEFIGEPDVIEWFALNDLDFREQYIRDEGFTNAAVVRMAFTEDDSYLTDELCEDLFHELTDVDLKIDIVKMFEGDIYEDEHPSMFDFALDYVRNNGFDDMVEFYPRAVEYDHTFYDKSKPPKFNKINKDLYDIMSDEHKKIILSKHPHADGSKCKTYHSYFPNSYTVVVMNCELCDLNEVVKYNGDDKLKDMVKKHIVNRYQLELTKEWLCN